jgi:hypothetical protein
LVGMCWVIGVATRSIGMRRSIRSGDENDTDERCLKVACAF